MDAWDLLVRRDDLATTEVIERDVPTAGMDEVVLKVDRVGLTANNITYALVGESMNYWNFFPADQPWGRVPLWGYADVVDSQVPGISVGARFYGYLPTSSHLTVRPERVDEHGFRDASAHRADLPRAYNSYVATATDESYARSDEDLNILYRPLFITSLMLDDFLGDNGFFGVDTIVMSSASSKTAYGTTFLITQRDGRPRLIALTSARNVSFTRTLPYDDVFTYDDLESITADATTLYVDVAGSDKLRARIHEHFGSNLIYDCVVGAAHMDDITRAPSYLAGPKPEFFFAPAHMAKRRTEWGPGGLNRTYAEEWTRFVPVVRDWVNVKESRGPEGLKATWYEVLAGTSDPQTGHIIKL